MLLISANPLQYNFHFRASPQAIVMTVFLSVKMEEMLASPLALLLANSAK